MVKCECGHTWNYKPRQPKKIPKRPKSRCSKCQKEIYIKRARMINLDHYKTIGQYGKIIEKNDRLRNIGEKLIILKQLDQGHYAQEIARNSLLSASKVSKIIKSFISQQLIIQIQSYPKTYQLTDLGKLFLEKGELNELKLQNEMLEKKIKPIWLKQLRVHKLRFKDKLIHKPSWLNRISREGFIYGLHIKKVELKNWDKYIIIFNYQDFNGLEKVEVCNDVIIYNFNRNKDEQYVSSKESLQNYFNKRREDCKEIRSFLEQKGFLIDDSDPVFCQKPHFAIETKGIPGMLGSLGQYLNLSIKSLEEIREVDDSPKIDGEEETDNLEKAESIFDVPQRIENIENVLVQLTNQITSLSQALTTLANGTNQKDQTQTDIPEEMFQ